MSLYSHSGVGMAKRVRVGVIGAGGIAQVEHVPNLLRLNDRFEVIGVADPSPVAREFLGTRYGLATHETVEALLSQPLDAVVIASPDPLHKEHVLAALARGFHVFCEKPLCYAAADIGELIVARDRARRVLQVGYMKRFDPSYEAAREILKGARGRLHHVSVEVHDPDAAPFVQHHDCGFGGGVPETLIAETIGKQREQVAKAVQAPLDPLAYKGFCGAYCSSLVHDVNAVHGLLEVLKIEAAQVVGAQLYADGKGGHGAVRLLDGAAFWSMMHLTVPKVPDYHERISFYFEDMTLELEFPSPYLNHQPTRLTLKRGKELSLIREDIRTSYAEAFIEELKAFHLAITEAAPVRNTAEQARRDMQLLASLAEWHATHPPQPIPQGATS